MAAEIDSELVKASNNQDWSEKIKIDLENYNLWVFLVEPSRYYDFAVYSAWKKKNTEAPLNIRRSCGPDAICEIMREIKSIKWPKSVNSSDSPSDKLLVVMETGIESSNIPVCDALFEAIKWGNVNLVVTLMKRNTQISKEFDDMSVNIFMCAIQHRQSEIFDFKFLANDDEEVKPSANLRQDKWKNNLLHMSTTLTPSAALNCISEPALQMQREVQWFKDVEKLVPPSALTSRNRDHMTPGELFTTSHEDLVVAREKWMKDTTYSFTIVGLLIITIMFAAAFRVPGGIDQNTGFPIFLHRKLFKVYIVSVAMSLFSATTSTLMSLKLLTSKYSEEEFLKLLTNKMISTLFLSLVNMIIAFCSALCLSLDGELTILIPVTLLACIPLGFLVLDAISSISCIYQSNFIGQRVMALRGRREMEDVF